MMRRLLVAAFAATLSLAVFAQQNEIPTPDTFLGYAAGERFTSHYRIVDYFRTLAARSPLLTVEQYGETYEGRPLMLAVITSEKNRADFDAIRSDLDAIAGLRPADSNTAASIAKRRPAVVWLAYGVHGNESSSAEAAMRVASTLLREAEARALLDDVIVIIDPLQNPDGRERYIEGFRRTRGAAPNASDEAWEHSEQWPGGRYNHYLIDLNRDWAWGSQKETRARVQAFRKWNPQVFVDLHEMGHESTYFFPPAARPLNTNLPKNVGRWLETFGRGNAEAFSSRGWPFFVGERFDLFYPAYGDSWPSLRGAIGMTYEAAGHGRAGLVVRREDGTVLTLADRIERHYTSSMATVRTAAANREALLLYTYNAMRAPLDDSTRPTFLIAADAPNAPELVGMLQRQGIEVGVLRQQFISRAQRIGGDAAENHTFPTGTYVVNTRQRLGGLAQTLLERTPAMQQEFVQEQREKAEADLPEDFYDITAWSLPLAMNVETWSAQPVSQAQVVPYVPVTATPFRAARYAYVVDAFDPAIYRFVGRLIASDVRFSVADVPVDIADRKFGRGSIVVLKSNNGGDLDATLQKAAAETNVTIEPIEAGWTGGTALGSDRIAPVKKPRIALLGGLGTSPTSFGMMWHTLDLDTPIPHTVISVDSLRNADLSHYNVMIMPDGDYGDRIGKSTTEKLQQWVRNGGTLIAIKGASSYLRAKDVEISKLKPWEAPKKKDADAPATDERYNQFNVPGAIFRTSMNDQSYLAFGVRRAPSVLIEGTTAYQPVSHRIDNVVTIDSKNALVSGIAWPESLEKVQGSVYLVSEPFGRGSVVTFTDEPHFRLFWRGTLPLLMNAVLYSPTFPR